MIYTTLNKILAHGPCGRDSGSTDGWRKLLRYLNKTLTDDEPLSLLTILESNGIDDALWALRAVDGYDREIRELACDFAERVLPLYEATYPGDSRARHCIEVVRKFARGEATGGEMVAARYAGKDSSEDPAAEAARAVARYDARGAAWVAARAATRAAARATWAAWDAAAVAAFDAEREWQRAHFVEWLHTTGGMNKMIYTTLNKILAHGPCGQNPGDTKGWAKLLRYLNKTLPDDEPLSLETILESNDLDDALWTLRAVDGYEREMRELACDFAEHVLPIYERNYPGDLRPRHCIEVARKYARGEATKSEMVAAWETVLNAAFDAARDATFDTARDAAFDAAWAAARAAAAAAEWDAAWVAEHEWQRAHFVEWLHTTGGMNK